MTKGKVAIAVALVIQIICTIAVIVDAKLDIWDHVRGAWLVGINLVCALANIALIMKEYRPWERMSS